jgi:hypothetical protein
LIGSIFSLESLLGDLELESLLGDLELLVLKNIWKSPAPSKVIAFSLKLVRYRLPTRDNLMMCGILVDGGLVNCVHCLRRDEMAAHLFLFCDFASDVWTAIFRWLGLVLIMPQNIAMLFESFIGAASSKKGKLGFYLIWHATVWMIWRSRNNRGVMLLIVFMHL